MKRYGRLEDTKAREAACCPACVAAYERWRYCRGCLDPLEASGPAQLELPGPVARKENESGTRDDSISNTSVSVLCPDTARRVDVADDAEPGFTERSEIPDE